ncbi:hypothetical protein KVV02_003285 [Mortierella alpina]|uniref:Uncharacterized protein n=1 Tax=Mortierella alpina TaxID=64518 RepID=A0A9P8CXW5_MORAP|nr:hypothetical protein KVV02_003285 [Mortierella alpina]
MSPLRLDTSDKHRLGSTGKEFEGTQDDQDPCPSARAPASPLTVISKERLEELKAHADFRIWNQVIVGGGREALKSACRIAQQSPFKTTLVLLEEDIVPDSHQKVVQSVQQKLSEWAQYLWIRETIGTIVLPSEDTSPSYVDQSTSTPFQTKPLKDLSLPSNVFIGSGLCATSILIDKSTTNQPCTDSIPKPVKRFSSVGGGQRNSLTINTTPPTPARIIGLEICRNVQPSGECYQVLCDSIVLVSRKHPLAHALNASTTPAASREGVSGRPTTSEMSADPSQLPRMVFSITMQHIPQSIPSTVQERLTSQGMRSVRQLLARISRILDTLAGSARHKRATEQGTPIISRPLLLHRSDRVFQQGRVKIQEDGNCDKDETFHLKISASTASYDPLTPIQVQVQVTTQPLRQHAFGNTEAIRHGEAVLMEGLVIARQLAHSVGWTCLEEDDSHMVEWVRDQMDIQWLPGIAADAETLFPACSHVEGVHTLVRSRTSSNGSLRVRTPNLSPYSSQTSSYQGRAKQSPRSGLGVELGVGLGIMNKDDSTLDQLRDASETLQNHKAKQREGEDQDLIQDGKVTDSGRQSPARQDQHLPVVTIAAAESGVSSPRPGLKTSFGGFSSLSESRTQTMALAEVTEDHLGMALSFPSPSVGTPSPKAYTPTLDPIASFGDGVSSSDLLGSLHNASSPPEPRKPNRFSIKTYQMERSKHGLSDEWALGSLDLTLGGTSAPSPPASHSSLSTSSPLNAGAVKSPKSSSPQLTDMIREDFLQPLDQLLADEQKKSTRPIGLQSGDDNEPYKNLSQGGNISDSGSLKSFESFGTRIEGTGGPRVGGRAIISSLPVNAPAESIPDFLGDSFAHPVTKSTRPQSQGPLDRVQSCPSASLSMSSTKVVHFADSVHDRHDPLRRAESDPCTPSLPSLHSPHGQYVDMEGSRRPSLESRLSSSSSSCSSSTSSISKSKAHTRRSWGQGIGGSDIQGLQGLCE